MKATRYMLTVVFAVLFAALLWGCSANGWATRDVPDGSGLRKGELVTVVQRDGSSLTGEFQAIEPITELEYASLYEAGTQQPYGERLPKLGQTIQFMTSVSDSKVWQREFAGFDKDGLLTRNHKSGELEHVYPTSIRLISDGHGDFLQRMGLRQLFLDGQIPLMSALVLHGEKGNVRIAISSISHLTTGGADTGTTVVSHGMTGREFRQFLTD